MYQAPYTFIMPHMSACCHEEALVGPQDRAQTNRAFSTSSIISSSALSKIIDKTLRVFIEFIRPLLPAAVAFDPYSNTAEDHLFSASKIDSQLDYVPISDGIQSGHHVGLTQPHMVEERPRRASHILDMPLTIHKGELAMFPTHYLRLEAHWCIRGFRRICHWNPFTFRVAAHADDRIFGR